jgi:peptidyl-prolyl cis-trans isomerase SurA
LKAILMMFPSQGRLQIIAENHLNNRYQQILMKIRSILIIMMFLWPVVSKAQDLNNKVLITIGATEIQAGEFMRMYNKSLEPGNTLDIDHYLQDYIVYKLKVEDALKEGYDTTNVFKTELNGYRTQLAQNYLTDNQLKDKLLQRAYQRSLTEINAWHVLITLSENASPEDTLKAWKKASDIRKRIITGESFEQVARGTSDDLSVKVNGGNLGYITVFQMIMPFEDAAYNLKKGAISNPVRTPYGYHIIKIADKRASKGKVKVAHIMKSAPPGTGQKEEKQAEDEINNIYRQLQGGASFPGLAKKFSDDKESAVNGGMLNWFGAGEIINDFSEAAFSLVDTGNFTKPVRTIYGWHIIKLLDRKSPGTFEESRSYLESKINQSYLNSISKKSFSEKLKNEYKFRINKAAYDWFVSNTDTLNIQGLRKYNRSNMPAGNIYSFADQYLTTEDFTDYIEKRGPMIITKDSTVFINRSIETRASDHLINYENSILETKYPEFRYLMNEFRDGILLFDISVKKVWDRVNYDTLGMHLYYEDHKNNYLSPIGIVVKIYTLKSAGGEQLLLSEFKKFSKKPDIDSRMIEKFNTKTDTLLIINEDTLYKGDDPEIDKLQWIPGSQSFRRNGYPSLILINKIIDPVPLKFENVRGEMINDYQEYLESEWIRQLKEKYSVKIDSLVLNEVNKKLNNEY